MSAIITVKEIMTAGVISVTAGETVEHVAALLFNRGITGVPVVDGDGTVVGMVTELDVISKVGQRVADIMSTDIVTVTEDTSAEHLAELLGTMRVRRVPVVQDGRLVGIVSRSDLVQLFGVTRWLCQQCGSFVRGFQRPARCGVCGSNDIVLDRESPGK